MEKQTWIFNNDSRLGKYTGINHSEYQVGNICDDEWDDVKDFPNMIHWIKVVKNTIEELDRWLVGKEIWFPEFLMIKTGVKTKIDNREGIKIDFDDSSKRTKYDVKTELMRLWMNQLKQDDFPFDIDKGLSIIFFSQEIIEKHKESEVQ